MFLNLKKKNERGISAKRGAGEKLNDSIWNLETCQLALKEFQPIFNKVPG